MSHLLIQNHCHNKLERHSVGHMAVPMTKQPPAPWSRDAAMGYGS